MRILKATMNIRTVNYSRVGEELTIKPAALDVYVKNSKNDVQVTLTYGTKRVLTTLTDNKGARLTGTDISSEVWDVVKIGKDI